MKLVRLFIGSIGILFLITSLLYGYEESYGIISGSKVQFRVKPDLQSKVHRHFLEGELVVYSGISENKMKIGDTSHYWYNVKTMDNKEGWVYGEFFNFIDVKIKPGKLYMKVIYEWLLSDNSVRRFKDSIITKPYNSIIFNVNLELIKARDYILFQFNELKDNGNFNILDGYSLLYKVNKDDVKMVLYTTPSNTKFYFLGEYIVACDGSGSRVYDTGKFKKNNYYPVRKEKVYKCIDRIHLRQVIKDIRKFNDSYIEFDKDKKLAIMYLRINKDEPMQKRVYKFEDGKFILVEDE